MKIGFVGKSNTGKSTFFSAATLVDAEISNRIFTTIKPNIGIAYLRAECPCKLLGDATKSSRCNPRNSKCEDGVRLVPITVIDVAGLVPGAHEGRGLGNQFLNDLKDADILIHVVDISGTTDKDGNPTKGHDPLNDIKFLEEEIEFWMLDILKRNWKAISRKVGMGVLKLQDAIYQQLSGLNIKLEDVIKTVNAMQMTEKASDEELLIFVHEIRKMSKPIILAANKIDLPSSEENFGRIKKEYDAIPCCAEAELALRRAEKKGLIKYVPGSSSFEILKSINEIPEKQERALNFVRKLLEKHENTGVQQAIDKAVRDVLGGVVVYPVEDENKYSDKKGNVLPDAYIMPRGSKALDLAYKVHTDIGKAFIGAIDCRTKKRIGKDYELKEGDVIKIIT